MLLRLFGLRIWHRAQGLKADPSGTLSFCTVRSAIFATTIVVLACAPQPEAASSLMDDESAITLSEAEVSALGASFATIIPTHFERRVALLNKPAPECKDFAARRQFHWSLQEAGRFGVCAQMALECLDEQRGEQSIDASQEATWQYDAASCLAEEGSDAEAISLFEAATAPGHSREPDFASRVFRYALESHDSTIINRAESALAPEEFSALKAAREYLITGQSATMPLKDLEAHVQAELSRPRTTLSNAWRQIWFSILSGVAYRRSDALRFLAAEIGGLIEDDAASVSLHATVIQTHKAIFGQPGGIGAAKAIYDAYLPYTHRDINLPVEENVATYSEIAATHCRESLSQGARREELDQIARSWLQGIVGTRASLDRLLQLNASAMRNADILTMAGSLAEELGQTKDARHYYWQAHKTCPYYNRSHWGLSQFRDLRRHSADPSHDMLDKKALEIAAGLNVPPEFKTYVINESSLSEDDRLRLIFSMRYWIRHVPFLTKGGKGLYVKRTFQRLSEVPGLEEQRDKRVLYAYDQRLWDDVRGVGGNPVVVDRSEMRGAPFGSYNLAAHEIAHQFHQSLPQHLNDCIHQLYEQAKTRGRFPDPYAKTNELEYFATGVTIYMTPEDAPDRFGLNRAWIRANDPALLDLIQQVEAHDVGDLRCPVSGLAEAPVSVARQSLRP